MAPTVSEAAPATRADWSSVHRHPHLRKTAVGLQVRQQVWRLQRDAVPGAFQAQAMKFDRYIGIDYSGAETPTSSLKGLRVFEADGTAPPVEVSPPPG